LPIQLIRARDALLRRFRPSLYASGLTDQQWRVIRALVEVESHEICELSERCLIHPASLSRILPKLDADGLIARCTSVEDQRRVIVSITPAGRRLFESLRPLSEKLYGEIIADVGAERIEQAYRLLEELIAALERGERERATDEIADDSARDHRLHCENRIDDRDA
jgi:homoprotocatechuate degradation regulator HpaR